MAEYLIEDSTLEGIANAIRRKDGTSASIQVSNYESRIDAIPSGSTNIDSIVRLTTGTFEEVNNG